MSGRKACAQRISSSTSRATGSTGSRQWPNAERSSCRSARFSTSPTLAPPTACWMRVSLTERRGAARWRTASRNASSIPSPTAPRPPSCAPTRLRLWFASMAYVLRAALRRIGLKGTALANATCGSVRLKLLKIGALVRLSAPANQVRHGLGPSQAAHLGNRLRGAHRDLTLPPVRYCRACPPHRASAPANTPHTCGGVGQDSLGEHPADGGASAWPNHRRKLLIHAKKRVQNSRCEKSGLGPIQSRGETPQDIGGTWPELDICPDGTRSGLGSTLGRPPHPFGDDMSCT